MSALYGLNGSGKTSVLQSARTALTGGHGAHAGALNDLHIRVTDVGRNRSNSFLDELSTFIDESVSRVYGEVFSPGSIDDAGWYTGDGGRSDTDLYFVGDDPGRNSADLSFPDKLKKFIELYAVKNRLIGRHIDLLESVASHCRLTLKATGDGTWSVWIAGRPDDARQISEHFENLELIVEKYLRDPAPPDQIVEWETDMIQEVQAALLYFIRPAALGRKMEVHSDLPRWLQVPLVHLGDGFSTAAVVTINEKSTVDDLDQHTLQVLKSAILQHDANAESASGKDSKIFEEIEEVIGQVEDRANTFLSALLPGSAQLRFNLRNHEGLLFGLRPCWEFNLPVSGQLTRRPVKHLSKAQLRWALASVSIALAEFSDRPVVFLCDEPEAGLHRLAERALARGLVDISSLNSLNIVAATHSPQILDQPEISKVLITREPKTGAIRNRRLSLDFSGNLVSALIGTDAGLSFGDILQLMRVAVVVEGLHDEIVFGRLLQPQLDAAHAGLFPIRGASRLRSLAEARLLFLATDAKILVVVDNVQNSELASMWSEITVAAASGDLELARIEVARMATLGKDEGKFLGELATAALEFGTLDRIEVFGLSQPDVICYLPTAAVLGTSAPPWSEIILEWTAKMNNKPSNIKGFLKKSGFLPQDPHEVDDLVVSAAESAASSIEFLNPEIVALGERIMALSTIRR
ncbi:MULTISPECIES: AAA family ATPase [Nocardiaceae]|uniref:ATP-binding protein n=1 Tax=Rhodococcoides kroppenstedtii TaxID=293050 RepID=A0ABS7NSN6_9NOCA|nr:MULTISPECIES: AAA family ATPase [Rhodococcus]MBY6313605.1 ATP-binding protein [Rhodococcus kroppenstedtii]MBY6319972.1 ATP-binding protein [Rhodococcus kroppenstedtii]MBY6398911.1 ATP-binding protein [Rhodococcus kroppenstedtii]